MMSKLLELRSVPGALWLAVVATRVHSVGLLAEVMLWINWIGTCGRVILFAAYVAPKQISIVAVQQCMRPLRCVTSQAFLFYL